LLKAQKLKKNWGGDSLTSSLLQQRDNFRIEQSNISGLSKAIISGLGKNQLRFFVADYRREDLDGQGNYRDERKRD
jgi:hypothetical protein